MGSLTATVLPLALGAAVSPTLLTLQMLILSGSVRPRSRAWAFTGGVAAGIVVYLLVLTTIGKGLSLSSGSGSPTDRTIKIIAAALLILLGLRALLKKSAGGPHPSRVAGRLKDAGLRFFFGMGLLGMASNFSSLVLIIPAVHVITNSTVSDLAQGLLLALLFFCTLAPVLLPSLAVSLLGHRSDRALGAMNTFTKTHAHQINAGIAFVFAAILLYAGLK